MKIRCKSKQEIFCLEVSKKTSTKVEYMYVTITYSNLDLISNRKELQHLLQVNEISTVQYFAYFLKIVGNPSVSSLTGNVWNHCCIEKLWVLSLACSCISTDWGHIHLCSSLLALSPELSSELMWSASIIRSLLVLVDLLMLNFLWRQIC